MNIDNVEEQNIIYSFKEPYTFKNIFVNNRHDFVHNMMIKQFKKENDYGYCKPLNKLYLNLKSSFEHKAPDIEVNIINTTTLPYDYIMAKDHFDVFHIEKNHSKLVMTKQLLNFVLTLEIDIKYYNNNLYSSYTVYSITNGYLYKMNMSFEGIKYLSSLFELTGEEQEIFNNYLFFAETIYNKDLLTILKQKKQFNKLTNISIFSSAFSVDNIDMDVYYDINDSAPRLVFVSRDINNELIDITEKITPYIYNIGKQKIAPLTFISQLNIFLDIDNF